MAQRAAELQTWQVRPWPAGDAVAERTARFRRVLATRPTAPAQHLRRRYPRDSFAKRATVRAFWPQVLEVTPMADRRAHWMVEAPPAGRTAAAIGAYRCDGASP